MFRAIHRVEPVGIADKKKKSKKWEVVWRWNFDLLSKSYMNAVEYHFVEIYKVELQSQNSPEKKPNPQTFITSWMACCRFEFLENKLAVFWPWHWFTSSWKMWMVHGAVQVEFTNNSCLNKNSSDANMRWPLCFLK